MNEPVSSAGNAQNAENASRDFHYAIDDDGIVTVTMDMAGQSANTMSRAFLPAMAATLQRLQAQLLTKEGLTGVVFTSAKQSFFAGGMGIASIIERV